MRSLLTTLAFIMPLFAMALVISATPMRKRYIVTAIILLMFTHPFQFGNFSGESYAIEQALTADEEIEREAFYDEVDSILQKHGLDAAITFIEDTLHIGYDLIAYGRIYKVSEINLWAYGRGWVIGEIDSGSWPWKSLGFFWHQEIDGRYVLGLYFDYSEEILINSRPTPYNKTIQIYKNTYEKVINLTARDLDGDPLTYIIVSGPEHGQLLGMLDGDNQVTYIPAEGFVGSDSFTFKVNDGEFDSVEATISITVISTVPDAHDQTIIVDRNSTKILINLIASDADGDPLTYLIVRGPENGQLLGMDDGDHQVIYVPEDSFNGSDWFAFKANDGENDSQFGTIYIRRLNRSPRAFNQINLIEKNSSQSPIVLSAMDLDNDPLTYRIVRGPVHGHLSDVIDGDHEVTYTPEAGFSGDDSFTFKVNDRVFDSNEATISLSVLPAWQAIAPPPFWYDHFELVGLSDDIFFLLGGVDPGQPYGESDECYEYDTQLDSWSQKTSMLQGRSKLGSAVIDNIVYAIGGDSANVGEVAPTNSVERYDPLTDTWTFVASMNIARSRIGAAVLDRNIYVFGGVNGSTTLNTIEIYDPDSDVWTLAGDELPEVCEGTAALTVENKIYVFCSQGPDSSAHLWIYDPQAAVGFRWIQIAVPDPFPTGLSAEEPNAALVGKYLTYILPASLDNSQLLVFDTDTFSWNDSMGAMDVHSRGASVGAGEYLYAIGGNTYGLRSERLHIAEALRDHNSSVKAFVARFYQLCLGREPDPNGLNYWVGSLIDFTRTGADVAKGFIFSPEFGNRAVSDEDYLDILYEAFFNRTAAAGGYNDWLDKLNSGVSRADVLDGFIFSQEFADLCNDYAITPFSAADPVVAFITRFYRQFIGREPDQEGLENWVGYLKDGFGDCADAAWGFVFSQEFVNKDLPNEAYLDVMYRAFFNRDPDPDGFEDWLNQLNFGISREDVVNGFIDSPEYYNLCREYGILPP